MEGGGKGGRNISAYVHCACTDVRNYKYMHMYICVCVYMCSESVYVCVHVYMYLKVAAQASFNDMYSNCPSVLCVVQTSW